MDKLEIFEELSEEETREVEGGSRPWWMPVVTPAIPVSWIVGLLG